MTFERAWEVITAHDCTIVDGQTGYRIYHAIQAVRKWTRENFEETPEPLLELLGALDEAGLA